VVLVQPPSGAPVVDIKQMMINASCTCNNRQKNIAMIVDNKPLVSSSAPGPRIEVLGSTSFPVAAVMLLINASSVLDEEWNVSDDGSISAHFPVISHSAPISQTIAPCDIDAPSVPCDTIPLEVKLQCSPRGCLIDAKYI
jgi:hypothetical protein